LKETLDTYLVVDMSIMNCKSLLCKNVIYTKSCFYHPGENVAIFGDLSCFNNSDYNSGNYYSLDFFQWQERSYFLARVSALRHFQRENTILCNKSVKIKFLQPLEWLHIFQRFPRRRLRKAMLQNQSMRVDR